MKVAMIIVRTLLGLMFIFASVTYFMMLFGMFTPPPIEGPMKAFNEGLAASGYFFTLLKITELVCGILLVTGRFVPLALLILSPIIINIFMVHVFTDRTMPGPVVAIFLVLANIFLAWYHWDAFRPVVQSKYQPLR